MRACDQHFMRARVGKRHAIAGDTDKIRIIDIFARFAAGNTKGRVAK